MTKSIEDSKKDEQREKRREYLRKRYASDSKYRQSVLGANKKRYQRKTTNCSKCQLRIINKNNEELCTWCKADVKLS